MRGSAAILAALIGFVPAGLGLSRVGQAAEFDFADARLEVSGSVKSIYTFTRAIDAEDFARHGAMTREHSWGLLTRARVNAEGNWRDRIYGQITYDNELRNGTNLDSLGFRVADELGTGTWFDADRTIEDHRDAHWRHALYRAWLRFESDAFEVTVGRQRIALGRGRLWNPTDLFNPIFPLAVESGQRVGQDAIVTRMRVLPELHAVGLWSPQDDPDEHRAAIRFEYSTPNLDAAVMAGRFRKDAVFGADFATNVADAALRGEATFTHDEVLDRRIWQVVGSIDYNLPVGSGLYVLAEHLFNENTVSPNALLALTSVLVPPASEEEVYKRLAAVQRPFLDRITTSVENQTGLQASYELTPLLTGSALVLYDWHGASAAFAPALTYSLSNEIVLSVVGQVFVGRRHATEYGDRPGLLILSLEGHY